MSRRWPSGNGPRPPGPRLPRGLVGLRALRDLPGVYDRAARSYGTRWLLGLPERDWLMTAEPDDAASLLAADPALARAGEASASLRPVGGPNSVVVLDGAAHLRARRVLLPPFHGERMRSYLGDMEQLANEMVDGWRPGEVVALHDEARKLSFRIILRAVLGIRDRERADEAVRRVERLFGGAALVIYVPALQRDLGPLSPWRRFLRLRRAADEVVYDAIAARRGSGAAGDDVLSMLLEARHEDGAPLSDEELRDELMTLLVAGHETTAAAIAWTVDLLLRNPHELARVREAVRAGERRYLEATVREAMRLRPPVPTFGRALAAPLQVGPYTVPAGTGVGVNTWSLHRRADLFPDPLELRPDRFLDGGPPARAYLPFGGGVRRCLGAAFAEQEVRVVVRVLLARVDLELVSRRPEGSRLRGVTLVPARGVPIRIRSAPRGA